MIPTNFTAMIHDSASTPDHEGHIPQETASFITVMPTVSAR